MAFEATLAFAPLDRSQKEELEALLPIEIGLFGGSGNYDSEAIENPIEVKVFTPFGAASDHFIVGKAKGRTFTFLARHQRGHTIPPHAINYRANIWGMKSLGVKRIISPAACGSLQPDRVKLGEFVIADQIFDRTFGQRKDTFFEGGPIVHLPFGEPFCPELRQVAVDTAGKLGYKVHEKGTYVCINGPRFSTSAESMFFHGQGWDVVGMTAYPEAALAREAGICFVNISMPTDYDVHGDEHVTHEKVMQTMAKNIERVRKLTFAMIEKIPEKAGCTCQTAMKGGLF
ncbi:MAG: S-methyl-5'-thioadenosine phosphorylase [Candidatus Thorarchaeota archaeon]|jgi:5'-methylthioadenosine phosphorylase|nr:MAG: S-methyl-5'-thioadenosine phosphorylase [Candidatus Thorarchaeota archaeon]